MLALISYVLCCSVRIAQVSSRLGLLHTAHSWVVILTD